MRGRSPRERELSYSPLRERQNWGRNTEDEGTAQELERDGIWGPLTALGVHKGTFVALSAALAVWAMCSPVQPAATATLRVTSHLPQS